MVKFLQDYAGLKAGEWYNVVSEGRDWVQVQLGGHSVYVYKDLVSNFGSVA